MVEKPPKGTAPSNLFINGRYILQPEIFALLGTQEKGAGNEIQLTDSMLKLMAKDAFWGVKFDGKTYDCGSKVGHHSVRCVWHANLRKSAAIKGHTNLSAGPGVRQAPKVAACLQRPIRPRIKLIYLQKIGRAHV